MSMSYIVNGCLPSNKIPTTETPIIFNSDKLIYSPCRCSNPAGSFEAVPLRGLFNLTKPKIGTKTTFI